MNSIRAFRLGSFAYYFGALGFLVISSLANISHAITKEECLTKQKAGTLDAATNDGKECAILMGSSDSAYARCDNAKRIADSKKDDFYKSCTDAGLGASSCKSKVKTCTETGENEEYKDDPGLLVAFSEALGVPQNKVGASCPKYSGQGFFERKDKYQRDLDDINKQLKDNKKELADLNKDFTNDVQEVQEEIAEAQKEYQELGQKVKEGQRDRAADQAKTAAEMAQNIRKLETSILTKRQEIDTIYMDKNNSLAQITEAAAKRTCMQQIREERKKFDNVKGGSLRSGFASASIKKKQLQDLFSECMVKFDQGRMKIIQQADAKVEAAEKEIRNAQSDIDSMKTQLSQAASLEQQAQQEEATQLTDAQNALQQKIQRATAKLQSLQQTTEQKAKAITEDQNYLTGKSRGISNQIASLGAAPEDETSTGKMSAVANSYDNFRDAARAANRDGCVYKSDLIGDNLSESSSERSSGQSKGAK